MTSPYFGGKPAQSFVMAVTLDAGKAFTVTYADPAGNPLDWNAAVSLAIDVGQPSPIVVDADVTGNQAAFVLSVDVCNQITGTSAWRLFKTTSDGKPPKALAVGSFERDDGG